MDAEQGWPPCLPPLPALPPSFPALPYNSILFLAADSNHVTPQLKSLRQLTISLCHSRPSVMRPQLVFLVYVLLHFYSFLNSIHSPTTPQMYSALSHLMPVCILCPSHHHFPLKLKMAF